MLLLTSLITTWIEFSQSKIPYAVPRCYADDLSLCTKARTKNALIEQTRGMHQLTAEFVNDAGMTINTDKSFTFGNKCVSQSIRSIPAHKNQFRLVGGSIKINQKSGWT